MSAGIKRALELLWLSLGVGCFALVLVYVCVVHEYHPYPWMY